MVAKGELRDSSARFSWGRGPRHGSPFLLPYNPCKCFYPLSHQARVVGRHR